MSAVEIVTVGLALVVLLVSFVVLKSLGNARRATEEADRALYRLEAVAAERRLVIKRAEQIGRTLEAGTAAVALGTDVVQTTHNVIADSVFSILDSIPATRENSALVKGVHDATSDGVYLAIGEVNKAFGGLLKGMTNPSARRPAPQETPKPEGD